MEQKTTLTARRVPLWGQIIAFTLVWVVAFLGLSKLNLPNGGTLQVLLYSLGGATLLGGLGLFAAAGFGRTEESERSAWLCPLVAGGLGLALFLLAYIFLGVWPVGIKSVMMVDMHHQYAPLLSELRAMLLEGRVAPYSYHVGLGTNFVPTFAYYLASPLNLLLLLFPERLLTVGILAVTLLKGAGMAVTFAACAQYITARRTSGVVAAALLYALSGYTLAYSWNIMWLDALVLLPLLVLCMERMLRTGKIAAYAVALGLALFINYYIGFMLCVFLVLYMAVWLLRQPRTGKEWLTACGRFALGSLLAGGLAAVILLPTALSLGRTSAAESDWKAFESNFPLFELIGRMLFGASPTIRSGNLPNLYCGVPAVLLAPIYLSQKTVSVRRRLCYGGLLAVLLLSCTINQWDLLWHGLHAPNDLPYRFSFLVCFVLLLLAARVFTELSAVTTKQVLASLGGCAVYLVLWEMLGGDNGPSAAVLYGNLLLLAVYGAVLLIGACKKANPRFVSRVLLTVICAELLIGSGNTLIAMNENEHFTDHKAYLDNSNHAVLTAAVERAQELSREEMGDAFYRLEYLPRTSCVDPALHHYAGLTTFASSNPYQTTIFMGDLGYAINGVNSYLYHSFVAPVDSLFGLRYVILSNRITTHAQLTLVEEVTAEGQTRYIYRNELALPLGYMANPQIKNYTSVKYAPFASQEALYTALTGSSVSLYTQVELEVVSDGAYMNNETSFHVPEGESEFSATITEKGQYFAFVDCRAAEDITVLTYSADYNPENTWNVTSHEPYIIDMGTMAVGETVKVLINSDTSASGNIHIVRLDAAAMNTHLSTLKEGGLEVTAMTETHIEGTVTAAVGGSLVLTIPYDKGWTVLVDGQPAATYPLAATEDGTDGALLCVEMPAGDHTVVLDYAAPGLRLGALVSVGSLVLLLLVWLIPLLWRRRKPRGAKVVLPEIEEEPFTPPPP